MIVPASIDDAVQLAADHLTGLLGRIGACMVVDGRALLRERTRHPNTSLVPNDHRANGDRQISVGGATRILRALDGWIAVTLSRPSDVAALPAWLDLPTTEAADAPMSGLLWSVIAARIGALSRDDLLEQGRLLSLAVAAVDECRNSHIEPVGVERVRKLTANAAARSSLRGVTVVDLTALWAGPLSGRLLQQAGARVIKVESVHRPDGMRHGSPSFFAALNDGKEHRSIDFHNPNELNILRTLINNADVVLESSRPRALRQLGLLAEDTISNGRPKVWASITGYGRRSPWDERVAFGDDAGVAAGLVDMRSGIPGFVGDAIADPITGLLTATAVVGALMNVGNWLLDVSMVGAASRVRKAAFDGVGQDGPAFDWLGEDGPAFDGVGQDGSPTDGVGRVGSPTDGVGRVGSPTDGVGRVGSPTETVSPLEIRKSSAL